MYISHFLDFLLLSCRNLENIQAFLLLTVLSLSLLEAGGESFLTLLEFGAGDGDGVATFFKSTLTYSLTLLPNPPTLLTTLDFLPFLM